MGSRPIKPQFNTTQRAAGPSIGGRYRRWRLRALYDQDQATEQLFGKHNPFLRKRFTKKACWKRHTVGSALEHRLGISFYTADCIKQMLGIPGDKGLLDLARNSGPTIVIAVGKEHFILAKYVSRARHKIRPPNLTPRTLTI